MKKILFILFSVLPSLLFSQVDSTEIYFKTVDSEDLRTICSLTDIQIIKLVSYDKQLKGKVFNLIIKEFNKGKIIKEDNLKLTRGPEKIPFVVNGDTMIYESHMSDYAGFNDNRNKDSLVVTFSGKLKRGIFKLNINYPGLVFPRVLKGKSDYRLRQINRSEKGKLTIPINEEFPILAFTSPFKSNSSFQSYCLLDQASINEWYDKFKIKRFYVIYLEIN